MNFEDELKIDKNILDYEWERQPSLVFVWGSKYADSIFERDKKKEQVELKYAEIDSKIRENPGMYDISKITETVVKSKVIQSKEYRTAMNDFLEAKKNSEVLAVARNALEHKKKALEFMTQLYLSGYWSDPNITKEYKDRVEKQAQNEQNEKLNKNTRLKRRTKN